MHKESIKKRMTLDRQREAANVHVKRTRHRARKHTTKIYDLQLKAVAQDPH